MRIDKSNREFQFSRQKISENQLFGFKNPSKIGKS
jgi:hypothetical protein